MFPDCSDLQPDIVEPTVSVVGVFVQLVNNSHFVMYLLETFIYTFFFSNALLTTTMPEATSCETSSRFTPIVTTRVGKLQGLIYQDFIYAYYGVPYAKKPIDQLRFQVIKIFLNPIHHFFIESGSCRAMGRNQIGRYCSSARCVFDKRQKRKIEIIPKL